MNRTDKEEEEEVESETVEEGEKGNKTMRLDPFNRHFRLPELKSFDLPRIGKNSQNVNENKDNFNLEDNETERRYNYVDRFGKQIDKIYENDDIDKEENDNSSNDDNCIHAYKKQKKQEEENDDKNIDLSKTVKDNMNTGNVGVDDDIDNVSDTETEPDIDLNIGNNFLLIRNENLISNPFTDESFNFHIIKINQLRKMYKKLISYYYALHTHPHASPQDIRNNYMILVKLLKDHTISSTDKIECYHLFQNAYKTLSDKFERFYYNVLHDHCSTEAEVEKQRLVLEKEADKIYEQKKKELEDVYIKNVEEEEKKNGLIIEKALYGNLILKDQYLKEYLKIEEIKEEHLEGPYYDITEFLQSKVENSNLIFNKESSFAYFCGIPKPLIKIGPKDINKPAIKYDYINMANKHALDGYDKNMFRPEHKLKYAYDLEDMELHVYIKYKFLNKYHEVTISDRTGFTLPRNTHRIVGDHICGPFSPANVIQMKKMPSSTFETIINFFSKHKIHITLFTTLLLCAQLLKAL